MEATKDRDRLELVNSILFGLGALGKSVGGWVQWLSNPSIMNNFSEEELEEMNKTITDFVKSFIEYDIKITKEGIKKGIDKRRAQRKPTRGTLYV